MSSDDPDRDAAYAAETRLAHLAHSGPTISLFGTVWDIERDVLVTDVTDAQRYVARVVDHAGLPPVKVRPRRGHTKAHYEHDVATIAVPSRAMGGDWALRGSVLLHEIAHHAARGDPGHGPAWRGAYLTLLGMTGQPIRERLMEMLFLDVGLSPARRDWTPSLGNH